MCSVLSVSPSGYYSWLEREPSERQKENEMILFHIRVIFRESRNTYGSRRITAALNAMGIPCSKNRVARLMRENNLKAVGKRKYKVTTNSKHKLPVAPNLLGKNVVPFGPDHIWMCDITYIPTKEGYEYLMVYLDLCTRKVVGWSINRHMREQLAIDALRDAYNRENPDGGLMVHTDRGAQFMSSRYSALIKRIGAYISMSRGGNPYDNAVVEAFNKSLKTELVDKKHPFETRELARKAIFEYIEMFYNPKRLHSALGYKPPIEFEKLSFNS